MQVTEPLLFLKYAVPCASVFLSRGKITKEFLSQMTQDVSKGVVKDEYLKTFKTALAFCTAIARTKGKSSIDREVIHAYFLERHNQLLPSIARPDVPRDLCRVRTGEVISNNKKLLVKTKEGEISLDARFIPKAKPGDKVSFHYNFACEILE